MVAGVGTLRTLPAHAEQAFALCPAALEAAVVEDLAAGLLPFFYAASLGTTSSCAVDPLEELGIVCERHALWCVSLHLFISLFSSLPKKLLNPPHYDVASISGWHGPRLLFK